MFDSITDSQAIDLNIVPISFEGSLLGMLGYSSQSSDFTSLKREIEVQQRLLEFVELDSPEYLEIKGHLDEVFTQLWGCQYFG